MLDRATDVLASIAPALHELSLALQGPGVLDRIGAGAIAVFVFACWLLAPSSRKVR